MSFAGTWQHLSLPALKVKMMNFSNATLARLAVHYVGNNSQALYLSGNEVDVSEELAQAMTTWFLNPFTNAAEKFEFTHGESLQYNETFNYVNNIFGQSSEFVAVSQQLARLLHQYSDHPRIKGGELYVAHFKNIAVGERLLEAVGIFKSENKAGFFEIQQQNGAFAIAFKEGVPANKLDKGCLVINEKEPVVYVIDNQNKGEEARYWKEDFLQVRPMADNYHYTKNFLDVTKQFIKDHLADRENISRMDQVKMLDESVNYFKQKEQFDINEFNRHVFNDPGLIESFQEYGTNYIGQNNMQLSDNFEIHNAAVKKQARIFKSVLKLDRNFHIYIHGNRDLIEQGYDERTGKKFYKLYFDEES